MSPAVARCQSDKHPGCQSAFGERRQVSTTHEDSYPTRESVASLSGISTKMCVLTDPRRQTRRHPASVRRRLHGCLGPATKVTAADRSPPRQNELDVRSGGVPPSSFSPESIAVDWRSSCLPSTPLSEPGVNAAAAFRDSRPAGFPWWAQVSCGKICRRPGPVYVSHCEKTTERIVGSRTDEQRRYHQTDLRGIR